MPAARHAQLPRRGKAGALPAPSKDISKKINDYFNHRAPCMLLLRTSFWGKAAAGIFAALEMEIFFPRALFHHQAKMGFNFFSRLPSSFPALGNFSKRKLQACSQKQKSFLEPSPRLRERSGSDTTAQLMETDVPFSSKCQRSARARRFADLPSAGKHLEKAAEMKREGAEPRCVQI